MLFLGVIVFILVCGGPPFGGKSQQAILEKVTSPDKQVAIPRKMSSSCRSLIRQLLCDDTALRFSAEEALKVSYCGHTMGSHHRLHSLLI